MIRRPVAGAALAALLAAAAWQAAAFQNETAPAPKPAAKPAVVKPAAAAPISPAKPGAAKPGPAETPMALRVAVLGVLNKRNGIWRDVTLHPGQGTRIGKDLIVRLRACDKTADWEQQQLTGAFVQVDVRGADLHWRRVFSGWLYKESPSLNVVENPIYDVWPKSLRDDAPGDRARHDLGILARRDALDWRRNQLRPQSPGRRRARTRRPLTAPRRATRGRRPVRSRSRRARRDDR